MLKQGITTLALFAGAVLAWAGEQARPIESARAGQWTLHHIAKGEASSSYEYEWAEKVEDRKVYLKTQAVDSSGKKGLAKAIGSVVFLDQRPPDVPQPPEITTFSEEDLTVAGKKLHCKKETTVATDPIKGKVTRMVWTSTDVPLFGLVRRQTLDKDGNELSRVELVDWGDTGGAERPLESGGENGGGRHMPEK